MSQWSELVRANTHIYSKNLMGVSDVKDYFKDYLLERIRLFSRFAYPYSGVFGFGGITSQLTDAVSILAGVGIDNNGNLVYWNNYQNMPIPKGDTLYYGVKYSELPSDVEVNPKTGSIEYARVYEVIGDVGHPDSVTDNGDGTLTLSVDSLFYGVPATGRVVRVLLVKPQTLTEWYADVLVESGNTITVPHFLGQVTPSEEETDYIVWGLGASVVTSKDDLTPSHIYLGSTTQPDVDEPPIWDKEDVIWLQAVTDHHTANLPSEIRYPHKLEKLDKYHYPQDNLLYNSYFFSGSAPTLNGWTLASSGSGASISVDSTLGDYGYTCIKYIGGSSALCTGTITANTTTNNNLFKVGKNQEVSFQAKCNLLSGTLSASGSSIKLRIYVYERDGSTLIETVDLTDDKISVNGQWVLIYKNGWKNTYGRSVVLKFEVLITSDSETCTILISSLKAEFGSSITIYTPHPSEINGSFGAGTSSTITTTTATTTITSTTSSSWTTTSSTSSTSSSSSSITTGTGTTSSSSITTGTGTTSSSSITTGTSTTQTTTTTSGGGSGCVSGDTEITLWDGSTKKISEMVKGDEVLTFDTKGNKVKGKVIGFFRHIGNFRVKEIRVGNATLVITPEHKISSLVNGDIAYTAVENTLSRNLTTFNVKTNSWEAVTLIKEFICTNVYNITVEPTHCYIANGVLISNAKQQEGDAMLK